MPQLSPGDRFPALRVETAAGGQDLSARWREQALVVVFMRHFGCAFCREHLARLSRAYAEIGDAGADVVAIFRYGADATRSFCESRRVPFDCVGDPLRTAYDEISLGRGDRSQLLGWKVAPRLVPALRQGRGMGGAQGGDMAQLPGTFVVASDGRVVMAHYSESSADNPPVQDVLRAVRQAAAAGSGAAGR